MLQHIATGVQGAGTASLAQVAGLPWWAQLLIGVGGVVLSFFANRQNGGVK